MMSMHLGLCFKAAMVVLPRLLIALDACVCGCSTSPQAQDAATSQPSRNAGPGKAPVTSSLLLQVTPFRGSTKRIVKLASDGELERWDASYLTVYRTGSARLATDKTSRLFTLAGDVPPGTRMGTGVREGDIYVLVNGQTGLTSVTIAPLAPAPMRKLVREVTRISESVVMRDNVAHYLRAEPVSKIRLDRLRASGAQAFSLERFATEDQRLMIRAAAGPYGFVPLERTAFDRVLKKTSAREFFVVTGDSRSWTQIGLWAPPHPPKEKGVRDKN